MAITTRPTGIRGLDEVLLGGFCAESSYLLVGSAGTGKTVLSLQWLIEGVRRGEQSLYITLAEPVEKVHQNVAGFGWSLDGIELVDLTMTAPGTPADAGEYHVFPPSDVENVPVWARIYDAVQKSGATRVVIDSLTQIRYLSTDEYQFRKQLLALVTFLDRKGCTSLLTFEPTELERETSVALAVDGIVRLRMQVSSNRMIGLRSLQVEKYRGSDFMSGFHPLRITSTGIVVYPHRIERIGRTQPGAETWDFGSEELDALLGGGLETGTTTLITGPAGVGKSTLATRFVLHNLQRGHRGVIYAFEESVDSLLARCRGIGMDFSGSLECGALRIVHVNVMELYPDELLEMVREAVADGCRTIVLDSLRGYTLAMEEFGTPVAHLHNLITYLNSHQVTTLLLNEVEYITGDLRATELGVSHLADNIILLRYAEHAGRVIKVIGCLKKRLSAFESELRMLELDASGIHVSGKLSNLRGILTGVPSYSSPALAD